MKRCASFGDCFGDSTGDSPGKSPRISPIMPLRAADRAACLIRIFPGLFELEAGLFKFVTSVYELYVNLYVANVVLF